MPSRAEPRRRSTRTSISHDQNDQKSIYFDGDDSDVDMSDEEPKAKRAKTDARGRGRAQVDSDSDGDDYNEEEDDAEEAEAEDDVGDAEVEEDVEDYKPKKATPKARGRPTAKANGTRRKQESDDEDHESDDSDAPAKITFIPNKKLRDYGDIEPQDNTVHPVSLLFLKDLKANNQRPWLKENDAEFRRAQKDWLSYVETFGLRLVDDVDDTIPDLPAKDIVFRIYRDTRFTKDPRPYKPHFSAAWSRTGKKGPYAHYYIHCEPGSSFVGAGMWHPDNEQLRLIRESIDEKPHRWRRVLVEDDAVRQAFFPSAKKGDDKSCIKAFANINAENALKKKPLGYAADHKDIELLKLRNFHVHKRVPDSLFTAADSQDQMAALLKTLVPFVTHINRIVRPDPGDEDTDEEDGEEGEDEEGDDDAEEDDE